MTGSRFSEYRPSDSRLSTGLFPIEIPRSKWQHRYRPSTRCRRNKSSIKWFNARDNRRDEVGSKIFRMFRRAPCRNWTVFEGRKRGGLTGRKMQIGFSVRPNGKKKKPKGKRVYLLLIDFSLILFTRPINRSIENRLRETPFEYN